MSVLKNLENQQTSVTSSTSTSRLDAIEQHLSTLTAAVNELTGYVQEMDETQAKQMNELTSQQCGQHSTLQLDAEMRNRLNEIEKTLAAVASQLSNSETVTLPSGEKITMQDVNTLRMMRQISEDVAGLKSSVDTNTEEVRKKSKVTFDSKSMGEWASKKIDATIRSSLDETFEKNRRALESTGENIVKDISTVTKADIGEQAVRWERVQRAVEKSSESIEQIENSLQWRRWYGSCSRSSWR